MADQEEETEIRELFVKASDFVKTVAGKLNAEKLLYLYARFKQANEGPCNVPKPGFFDFQGKQKWDSWNKMGQKTKKESMLEYIDEVTNLFEDWEDQMDSGKVKPKAGMGVSVSTMANPEDELLDHQKTIFDWCKDGNIKRMAHLIENIKENVDQKDEEGMALLHWACDRGNEDMVSFLLKYGANINIRDSDGQTALHYAVSCEHIPVVRLLLIKGIDKSLLDNDGESAQSLAENCEILQILEAT